MNIWKLAKKNNAVAAVYENEVIKLIRKRYTINQELAILRQRDTKPDEFEEYNTFVEECKKTVKRDIEEEEQS